MSGRAVRRHRRPGHSFPQASDDGSDGAGPGRCYEELYVEHAPAARGLALSMVPPDVADDIVAEAFARVLAAIRAGGGPDHAFRPYLLAAVRNLANDWIAARRRVTVIGDLGEEAGDRSALLTSGFSGDAETEAEARAEARLIVRAFSRLPERWRAAVAAGGRGQGARRGGTGVRPVRQRGFRAGDAGQGGTPAGLPAGAHRHEHPGVVPRVRRGPRCRGPRPAEPAPPGRHAGPPRALPGVPGPVYRAFR